MANESIEQLTKRYNALNTKKNYADANLLNATKELARIQEEAIANWGTDDLAALEKKLEEMRKENEKKRAEYQSHLEEIEARLAAVEENFRKP